MDGQPDVSLEFVLLSDTDSLFYKKSPYEYFTAISAVGYSLKYN
jgi:hypothetical protein